MVFQTIYLKWFLTIWATIEFANDPLLNNLICTTIKSQLRILLVNGSTTILYGGANNHLNISFLRKDNRLHKVIFQRWKFSFFFFKFFHRDLILSFLLLLIHSRLLLLNSPWNNHFEKQHHVVVNFNILFLNCGRNIIVLIKEQQKAVVTR